MLNQKHIFVTKSLGLGALIIGLVQTPAIGFTLDLFDDVENTTFNNQIVYENLFVPNVGFFDSPEDTDTVTNSDIIGDNRHLKITIDPSTNTSNQANLTIDATQSLLSLSTEANINSTGLIVWNGSSDVDFANLVTDAGLGLDLEADGDGDDSIGITIKFSDLAATDGLSLTLYEGTDGSDDGTTHTISLDIPVVATGNSETLYFEYAEYESAGVNINSIEYIALEISGVPASDLELDFLETAVKPVPFAFSPGLGLLISCGLFGFLGFRSRKVSKSENI